MTNHATPAPDAQPPAPHEQRDEFEHPANYRELSDLHDAACDRFQTYGYGTRSGTCDCASEVTALLHAYRDKAKATALQEAADEIEKLANAWYSTRIFPAISLHEMHKSVSPERHAASVLRNAYGSVVPERLRARAAAAEEGDQ